MATLLYSDVLLYMLTTLLKLNDDDDDNDDGDWFILSLGLYRPTAAQTSSRRWT